MLKHIHIEITRNAARQGDSATRALEAIISANLKQDRLLGLLGHDEYHFDSNAFAQSYAYLEEQRPSPSPPSKRMISLRPGLLLED